MNEIRVPVDVVFDEDFIRASYDDYCTDYAADGHQVDQTYDEWRTDWIEGDIADMAPPGCRIERRRS